MSVNRVEIDDGNDDDAVTQRNVKTESRDSSLLKFSQEKLVELFAEFCTAGSALPRNGVRGRGREGRVVGVRGTGSRSREGEA